MHYAHSSLIHRYFTTLLFDCLPDLRAPDKKAEVEKVLLPISQDKFSDITAIGKLITDYTDDTPAAGTGMLHYRYYNFDWC